MNRDSLKLTMYFGERDRADGRFLADALVDLYAERDFATSVVLRGAEGFGLKHHLRTERLLTLSEDLPVVSVAVDTRDRIDAALGAIGELTSDGLITLERARMLSGSVGAVDLPDDLREAAKLTVYCGRQERAAGRAAFLAVVDLLRSHGVAGATVLLGVDGTAHGVRQRASFLGRNAEVPLMIIGVGDGERIASVLPALGEMLERPLMTLERIRVCKRDGELLGEPQEVAEHDGDGRPVWLKLMVHSGEGVLHEGRSLHVELIRRLREAGAGGATALRGIWGYHGDHPPHGDRLRSLRRRVPVVTVIVDEPAAIRSWFRIVDEVTAGSGLVTSEIVPAARATSDGKRRGTLDLDR